MTSNTFGTSIQTIQAEVVHEGISLCVNFVRGFPGNLSGCGRPVGLLLFLGVLVGLDASFQKLYRLLRPPRSRHFEVLAALLVIGDEKFLQLIEQGFAHIVD